MMCEYGCGILATNTLKNGKLCCSSSANGCPINKGKNSAAIKKSIQENNIDYKTRYSKLSEQTKNKMMWNKGINPNTLFEYGGKGSHKEVLIKERQHKCEMCNRCTWNKQKITLELEHIDGDSKNNVRENLQLLCPNCHSQTSTWRRRKSKGNSKKHTDEEIIAAIKSSTSMNSTLDKLELQWGSYKTILSIMERYNIDLTIWGS